jgi:hypothetical protein
LGAFGGRGRELGKIEDEIEQEYEGDGHDPAAAGQSEARDARAPVAWTCRTARSTGGVTSAS